MNGHDIKVGMRMWPLGHGHSGRPETARSDAVVGSGGSRRRGRQPPSIQCVGPVSYRIVGLDRPSHTPAPRGKPRARGRGVMNAYTALVLAALVQAMTSTTPVQRTAEITIVGTPPARVWRCSEPRQLATDATQTVRTCEWVSR